MQDFIFFNDRSTHPNLVDKLIGNDWKYLLNLASTEFPLRTNYELARILSIFNGANDIEMMESFPKNRVAYSWSIKKNSATFEEYLYNTRMLKKNQPHNYTIVKGITYCSFSHDFVKYALTNEYAKDLLAWSIDTYSPDEWLHV
jgi:hypothetical protein